MKRQTIIEKALAAEAKANGWKVLGIADDGKGHRYEVYRIPPKPTRS